MRKIVIVGAGQAAATTAAKLRSSGFDGAITLIGAEPLPPYERPPLSKAYLLGEIGEERLYLRARSFWDDQQVTLRLGQPASRIDPVRRIVEVGTESVPYDELVLATGARPQRLPAEIGGALHGVHTIRTLADVDAMKLEFQPSRRVVIVCGGYIGLEAAAVAAKLGLDVTVLEMAPRILQRVAAPETSAYFRALHAAHGVKILEEAALDRILGGSRAEGVRLRDGRQLPADFVIVGVGIEPDTALAAHAGLQIDTCIRTDARGRTSAARIWAAGDCASFPWNGRQVRLESVGNAIDMGELVAANIMGAETDYQPKPWFWSDQYDCKLQIAGLNHGYDRIVTRGAADAAPGGAVSFWYYRGETLLAVDAMNDPRAYMVAKRLIEAGRSPDPVAVADAGTDLKLLLKG